MNLCFIHSATTLDAFPAAASKSTHFVCPDWMTQQQLRGRGLHASLASDEITPELGQRIDDFALALSCNWYRDQGRDFTLLDGVSLGALYEYMVWLQTLQPAYKRLAAVAALFERESPARIWLDADMPRWLGEAVSSLSGRHGIPLEHLAAGAEVTMPDSLAPWRPWSLRPVDRLVLGAYNATADVARLFRRGDRIRLLACYYPALDLLFDALASDPRFDVFFLERPPASVLRKHLGRGSRFLFPRHETAPCTLSRVAEIQEQWASVRADSAYRAQYLCDRSDGWPLMAADLDRFFSETLPRLAGDAAAYREAIARQHIDFILLPFDTVPILRSAIEIGKALGISSMIALHGLPAIYNTRHNCCGDYLAAWGVGVIDVYKALGCSTARMWAAGSPKLDVYVSRPKHSRDAIRRILILTNPKSANSSLWADDEPEEYILAVFDALRDWPKIELIVRPHPSELPAYYRDLLAPLASSCLRIEADTPIAPLMDQCDLLITPATTVVLEAMLLDKPVIWFNPTHHILPPPFTGEWMEELTDAETLRDRLGEIIAQGKRPAAETQRILDAFAGPVDGCASQRILDWIADLTGNAHPRAGRQPGSA